MREREVFLVRMCFFDCKCSLKRISSQTVNIPDKCGFRYRDHLWHWPQIGWTTWTNQTMTTLTNQNVSLHIGAPFANAIIGFNCRSTVSTSNNKLKIIAVGTRPCYIGEFDFTQILEYSTSICQKSYHEFWLWIWISNKIVYWNVWEFMTLKHWNIQTIYR